MSPISYKLDELNNIPVTWEAEHPSGDVEEDLDYNKENEPLNIQRRPVASRAREQRSNQPDVAVVELGSRDDIHELESTPSDNEPVMINSNSESGSNAQAQDMEVEVENQEVETNPVSTESESSQLLYTEPEYVYRFTLGPDEGIFDLYDL